RPAPLLQTKCGDASFQAFFDFLLEARIGVNDVPLLGHRHATPQRLKILNTRLSTHPTLLSTPKKKTPKKATATITTKVVTTTSCRVGQVTWRSSTRTSCRNSPQRLGYCIKRSQSAPPRDSGTSREMPWHFDH